MIRMIDLLAFIIAVSMAILFFLVVGIIGLLLIEIERGD